MNKGDSIKSLIKDSAVYGLGEFITKLTQVLILPLIFIYLNKSEFGTLDYFLTLKNIVLIFYGWGIITAIFRYAADRNELELSEITFNSFLLMLFLNIIFTGILLLFLPNLNQWLLGPEKFYKEFILTSAISSIYAFRTIPMAVLRLQRKPMKYIYMNFTLTVFIIILPYILLKFFNLSYFSFLYGHLSGALLSLMLGLFFIRKYIGFKFNFELAKKLYHFGFSILITSISFVIILSNARFFLKIDHGFDEIGILGMVNRLALFVGALLVSPFALAWLPYVNSIYGKDNFHSLLNNVFSIFTFVGVFLTIILSVFAADLFKIINDFEYYDSIYYLPYYGLSYLFYGYYFIFSAGIYLTKRTKYYKIIGVFAILFNYVLYLIFLSKLTLLTVSIITLSTYIGVTSLTYIFGNRILKIQLFRKRNIVLILSNILLLIVLLVIDQVISTWLISFILRSVIVIIFPIFLGVLGVFEIGKLKSLMKLIK